MVSLITEAFILHIYWPLSEGPQVTQQIKEEKSGHKVSINLDDLGGNKDCFPQLNNNISKPLILFAGENDFIFRFDREYSIT